MNPNDATPCFFFIHVMKTGGTSFVFQLLANFEPAEVYPNEVLDRRHPTDVEPYASLVDLAALTPERRDEIRVYTGHLPYMARELMPPDVVTMTILRDPVDRTLSVLKHFKRLYARYRDLPLDAIYDDPLVFRNFVENFQTRVFALTRDDRPQSFASSIGYRELRAALDAPAATPRDASGDAIVIDDARLALAKSNLAKVDVIGSNARFPDFVEQLRRRFGWWSAGPPGDARANVSSEPWKESDSLRGRIRRDNRFDVAFYEHAQELIRERRS